MATLTEGVRLIQSKYEGSSKRMVCATFFACIGALSFGYTIGYSSPAIPSMLKARVLEEKDVGWFGSLMTIGALAGGPFGGWCIEKFGRRKSILLSSLPFIFGWLAIVYATDSKLLFQGRFATGFASGMVTVCIPIYLAEISTKSMRGVLGSCMQLCITVGIFWVYTAGLKLEWQSMASVAIIPAVLQFVAVYFLPETPQWLLSKGRKADALKALKAIRDPHQDVQEECRDIDEGFDHNEEFSWSEFRKSELMQPLIICSAVLAFQQFSGINAVMFYTVSIFQTAIPNHAHIATVIIGGVQVVATVVACFLMDRAGRRKLLIGAGIVMTITLLLFGQYYRLLASESLTSSLKTWFPVICLTFYMIGFSLGWGPIPMLLMSEIFPSRARGAASAIAMFVSWLTSFFVTNEFMTMQNMFGASGTFNMFGFSCLLSVIFVWRYVPETKGKSLEDIELYFLGKSIIKV
ncbi:solute carrier family 2, facilitated glucose transporter member 8-like [Gigantopelta aegis]|uniref:solute carrier family 2, facilitated glucose transporter member 8-like n=1 Tax=Gigantopelta aegis TaxID=1735272 RepID=UPI001B88930A|nr:solute carrier family 2, facilitated glucose transporter member 8-like [Gigantopelta aegis]